MAVHSMVDGMGRTDGLRMREADGDGMVLPRPWMRGEWLSDCYAIQCEDESDNIVLLALSACAASGGESRTSMAYAPKWGAFVCRAAPLAIPCTPHLHQAALPHWQVRFTATCHPH